MITVEIGAFKTLRDYTQEERVRILDDLSLLNPEYVSAQKFSSYSRITVPMYLTYYHIVKGAIVVPRGYEIPFPHKIISDERFTTNPIQYPKFKLKLRVAQKEAVEAYLKSRENGDGMIILQTGKGKSQIGVFLASKLKQRCLIIVHKDDLVDGWKSDIKLSLGLRPKQIGLIKGKVFRIGKQITLTTIQTLSRLSPEKIKELHNTFSMIICDECHHVPSKSFEYMNYFPAKDRIGLTATDMRNDGLEKVMNFILGNVCYRFEEQEDDEDIISAKNVTVKIKGSGISYNPPTEYVKINGRHPIKEIYIDGECYVLDELEYNEIQELINQRIIKRKPTKYADVMKEIWGNEDFNKLVAKDIKGEYKKGKSCLALCIEKEHCKELQEVLIAQGIPKNRIQLYFGDSIESKPVMKAKAESKECLITIATYAIAKEGTNVKAWERIFLAMTINNELDTTQAIGRGRRTLEGKKDLIVYDYSHLDVKGAKNHINTRIKVYEKLGFNISNEKDSNKQSPYFGITKGFKRAK